jgi:antitoxin component of RelBE/YafQ-DinJ toxin-antitoxin module
MKKKYDFSNAIKNPYAKRLKKQLTIRLDEDTISYFQGLSRELSLPYQTLINMYLRDCAETRKRPHWAAAPLPEVAVKVRRPAAATVTRRSDRRKGAA